MKKNIGTQEAHVRTIAGVILLLFALLLVEDPWIKIFFAVVAAALALTSFLRTCPINTRLHRNTFEGAQMDLTKILENENLLGEKREEITVEEKTTE